MEEPRPPLERDDVLRLAHELMAGTVSGQFRLPDDLAVVAASGSGAHLYDLDGRRYIDYMLGSGPALLGHAHPEVAAAIAEQAAKGSTFYVLNSPTIELAQRIVDVMPCAQQVKFASSGLEATLYALRMARVFTGKPKILKFAGGFHGSHDVGMINAFTEPAQYPCGTFDSGGVPDGIADDVIVSRWNDFSMTEDLIRRNAGELAAVICEPMQRCLVAAPGFLRMLRDVTAGAGVLLIFDEMVTGFRFALGGAQERYGVVPDLATFGKALTNGMPMTGIAGAGEIIEVAQPQSSLPASGAYYGNTLNGNPLCAAAGLATLGVLSRPGTYDRLEATTGELRRGIERAAADQGVDVQLLGDGPVVQIVFAEHTINDVASLKRADSGRAGRFLLECARRRVLSSGKFYVSAAHSDDDVAETVEVIAEAMAASAA